MGHATKEAVVCAAVVEVARRGLPLARALAAAKRALRDAGFERVHSFEQERLIAEQVALARCQAFGRRVTFWRPLGDGPFVSEPCPKCGRPLTASRALDLTAIFYTPRHSDDGRPLAG